MGHVRRFIPSSNNFLWVLGVLTVARLIIGAVQAPSEDELYYWAWSQLPSLSYFDHPPITAWSIWLSTVFFGDTVFAIRLPAILYSTATILILARVSSHTSVLLALLFTPVFFFASMTMTPDTPLLFFWALYLEWAMRLRERKNWVTGGFILGLGFLSKYTMLLAAGCSAMVVLYGCRQILPRERQRWLTGYALHGFIAALCALPVLIFNYQYDFKPFLFQWEHIQQGSGFYLQRFLTFWGWQIALVGFLPFVSLPRLGAQAKQVVKGPLMPCLCFFGLPAIYFFYKTLTATIEANWNLAMYLAFWPLAAHIWKSNSWKILAACFAPAWLANAVLLFHVIKPLPFLPPPQDRLRMAGAKLEVARLVAEDLKQLEVPPVFYTPNYQWTALFRFTHTPTEQLPIHRPSHFTLLSNKKICDEKQVYFFFGSHAELPAELGCFEKIERVKAYDLKIGDYPIESLTLFRFEHSK